MTAKDFDGFFKYQLIVPVIYIASWLAMFLGPFYFDREYQVYCMIMLIYSGIKAFQLGLGSAISIYKMKKIIA